MTVRTRGSPDRPARITEAARRRRRRTAERQGQEAPGRTIPAVNEAAARRDRRPAAVVGEVQVDGTIACRRRRLSAG
jgi:hypothetical protein